MEPINVTIFTRRPSKGDPTYRLDGVRGTIRVHKRLFPADAEIPATLAIVYDGFAQPNAEMAAKAAKRAERAAKRAARVTTIQERAEAARKRAEKAMARARKLMEQASKAGVQPEAPVADAPTE